MVMEIVSNTPRRDRQGKTPKEVYLTQMWWREYISGINGSDI